jgi:hypothetical protein
MYLGEGKGSQRKADNLTAICEPIVYKMWEPRRLTNLWASTAFYGDSFTPFFFSSKVLSLVIMLTETCLDPILSQFNSFHLYNQFLQDKLKLCPICV